MLAVFIASVEEKLDEIQAEIITWEVITATKIKDLLTQKLSKVFEEYFNSAQQAGNLIVKQEIAKLTDALSVPLKYTKGLITDINNVSVFKGYYNQKYAKQFTRKTIDAMKRRILTATYSGFDEARTAKEILKVIEVPEWRARLLARTETQRLKETSHFIYHQQPEVADKYDRIWIHGHAKIPRQSHQEFSGTRTEEDGLFHTPWGVVQGPGDGSKEETIGCTCHTEFVKKAS